MVVRRSGTRHSARREKLYLRTGSAPAGPGDGARQPGRTGGRPVHRGGGLLCRGDGRRQPAGPQDRVPSRCDAVETASDASGRGRHGRRGDHARAGAASSQVRHRRGDGRSSISSERPSSDADGQPGAGRFRGGVTLASGGAGRCNRCCGDSGRSRSGGPRGVPARAGARGGAGDLLAAQAVCGDPGWWSHRGAREQKRIRLSGVCGAQRLAVRRRTRDRRSPDGSPARGADRAERDLAGPGCGPVQTL